MMLFIVAILARFFITSSQQCVMKGQTDSSSIYRYDGPAIKLEDEESIELFTELCSSLLPESYNRYESIYSCCDKSQLKFFKNEIYMLAMMISSCSICLENMMRLTCNIICSANQSNFIVPINESESEYLSGIDVNISNEFATNLYDSCKNVNFPIFSTTITEFLCQGSNEQCTPQNMITGMFSHSSFRMVAKFTDSETANTLNAKLLLCNQSYQMFEKEFPACECVECEASCTPIYIELEDEPEIMIFGKFNLFQFIILAIFAVISLIYWLTFILMFIKICVLPKLIVNKPINSTETEKCNKENKTEESKYRSSINYFLYYWGDLVSSKPIPFVLFSCIFIILCFYGLIFNFEITSDPIEIWSPKNGVFRKHKNFYDEHFGPFYRTEQIIIKRKNTYFNYDNSTSIETIFNFEILNKIFNMQKDIERIQVNILSENSSTTVVNLSQICFKPLGDACATFSFTQYFQNKYEFFNMGIEHVNDTLSHIYHCLENPFSISDSNFHGFPCLSEFMSPVDSKIIFGGYEDDPTKAEATVITFMVNNYNDKKLNYPSEVWESAMLDYLQNYNDPQIEVSYMCDRSIEDEIDRQSTAEIRIILASYIAMFVYTALFLGKFTTKNFKAFLVHQKIMIGLAGVVIVIISVLSAVGIFSFFGIKVNMIVLEVMPFLVLAVGVDNIFLMVNELNSCELMSKTDRPISFIIGQMLSQVGQGMIVSNIAQIVTFSIGAVSNIPAVKSFSLFAAAAIGINFLLQLTLFLVLLTYDIKRERQKRSNIFCCWKFSNVPSITSDYSSLKKGFATFSRIILSSWIKPFLLYIFVSTWFFSLYNAPKMDIGLDQTSALAYDSYLTSYFEDLFRYSKMGPPVYFIVTPGFNYENQQNQKKLCHSKGCDKNSLSTSINLYSRISEKSYIASNTNSWIDAFYTWLNTRDFDCCQYKIDEETKNYIFCPSNDENYNDCVKCPSSTSLNSSPMSTIMEKYLPWFLNDIPNMNCPFGGKPLYGKNVHLNKEFYENGNRNASPIITSAFMTYHTPLKSSQNMIEAMDFAIQISKIISENINHTVFPYSQFYIYYESYFTIKFETILSFAISLGAVFLINLILQEFNFIMTILITLLVFLMIMVNVGGMFMMNIKLNPVSLVNLIMFVGINIEFLSHISRAYINSNKKTRQLKATEALIETGSSVFCGIALTKFIGISVLFAAHSQLFRIYYFQMYLTAIIVGTLHGLVLLPILLSYIGPR